MVHAYDPEMIVIGGQVMKSADVIIPYVESCVQKHSGSDLHFAPWRPGMLGNNVALLGAVPLLSET
jgi:glucokinase